jgi:hypothetical protein
MEKEVVAHLGQLMREFNSGELDVILVLNAGEFSFLLSFSQAIFYSNLNPYLFRFPR